MCITLGELLQRVGNVGEFHSARRMDSGYPVMNWCAVIDVN